MEFPRSAAGITKTSCPLNWLPLLTDGSVLSTDPRGVFVELSNASPTAYSWPRVKEHVTETGIVTAIFEFWFNVAVDMYGVLICATHGAKAETAPRFTIATAVMTVRIASAAIDVGFRCIIRQKVIRGLAF